MRWLGSVALLAGIAGCGTASEVGVEEPGQATFDVDELTELYLVEFEEPSITRGGTEAVLDLERSAFRSSAANRGLRYRERFTFNRLWNGFSVEVGVADAADLARLQNVKAVFPMVHFEPDGGDDGPGNTSNPEMASAITMTGAATVRQDLGLTGEGVVVAVIDSGIDYDHPDLGNGCFGPGCRVAYGYDFVGDAFNSQNSSSRPVPDPYPDDCGGHGTHVAGIIGASGVITGVAPEATLAGYRVFGCSGSTSADIMIAAMERARNDGARVVNMSIGSPFAWPEYPTAVAADQLVEDGVVVVTSGGNSGTSGLWATGAPGTGKRVIATAAVINLKSTAPTFEVEQTLYSYNQATASALPPSSGSFPLVRTGAAVPESEGCADLPAGALAGKVVLVRRGGCTFHVKALIAQNAGAAAAIIYNNQGGSLSPTVAGTPAITIPVVAISQDLGDALNAAIGQGANTLNWSQQVISTPADGANMIASYSSYGMTAELDLKPDIAAPGEYIWSTYPLELGGYSSQGGTSMASPHVAGTVALLLQGRSGIPAWQVRDVLQNSAVPVAFRENVASGLPDHTFRQGAGMVRIDRAIASTVFVTPGKLSLGEDLPAPHAVTLHLQNVGDTEQTYTVSHLDAPSATGNHFTPTKLITNFATVTPATPTVTVPAGGTADLEVAISSNPAMPEGTLYGGYVVLTPQTPPAHGDGVLRIPFAGYKGDYQLIPTIDPNNNGYPWLARHSGSSDANGRPIFTNQPNGGTFSSFSGTDLPYVVAFINHSPRKLILDVFEATTQKPWGRAREVDYVFQNAAATDYSYYSWNGTTTLNKKSVKVPNGRYIIKMKLLRALGDENNPAHWDNWTSPVITINRP
ncbi:S8 family serine peptidase [Chondromyces crocatus]|uniref:Peptidase S8 n=1 Tax=Chondromyces crocatus TaxID=52 RepID=A0A0K1E8S2_CHOCO|nr:S8 family serine peptidase [Chondromyces crocatus]AKT37265.1 peptidase S8 [Chondromyces crocatus]